jgi:signal transduction histidine kinase
MKYVVVGMLIGWIGAECMFLPAFRIDIYPVANFLIVGYTIIITYAIIRHRLMDINIVIQKSFIYSILIALITATYFVFVFLAERFFQGMVGYTSLIMSILYAFVIALFFNPVKNKIQHLADRIFLGKDPLQIARENELLRQELERSEHLKAVATLASGMAHEIKNPLTAIKTFSEYLPQKYQDPQFLNKFSHLVTEQVDKIDNLVHQLLDFAKPANLHLEQTDIHKLLDETLDLLSSDLLKHRIKLIKDYSDSKLISVIDANQIKQVFLNLFLNAIEAMTSGGTLSIKTESNHSNQDKITVIIADTGIGIADKDLPHIFEPFYSTKKEGTGLGLSIVYNIIKEHKGTIRAESKVNEGTKFIIELPRTQK